MANENKNMAAYGNTSNLEDVSFPDISSLAQEGAVGVNGYSDIARVEHSIMSTSILSLRRRPGPQSLSKGRSSESKREKVWLFPLAKGRVDGYIGAGSLPSFAKLPTSFDTTNTLRKME